MMYNTKSNVHYLKCGQIYWIRGSVANREPMQYRSVAVRGCSYQLFDKDQTTLVPAECFLVLYIVR